MTATPPAQTAAAEDPPAEPKDFDRAIASLVRGGVTLSLDTRDLCFLLALRARLDRRALVSLEEESLVETFEQVSEWVEPGAANPRKSATHAIQRLRDQRLLARVDTSGIVRAGEFALTRLAAGIVEFFLADETLTRESLALLTKTLIAQLGGIRTQARRATTADDWATEVVAPLNITVADLLTGIERRQRGMDAQQEEVVEKISQLLHADWFEAVAACERLLETTAQTLRELNAVLLQDTSQLLAVLQDVEQLASDAGAGAAVAAIRAAVDHVERVAAWGSLRLNTWSRYYQHVHGYLRDVVRLDPDRAISQRLRDALAAWPERSHLLAVADEPSIKLLRDLPPARDRVPVARPREDRGPRFESGLTDDATDLEALVEAAIKGGASALTDVVGRILGELPEEERYRAVGRIAEIVARHRIRPALVHPWLVVSGGLEVQEWRLAPRKSRK